MMYQPSLGATPAGVLRSMEIDPQSMLIGGLLGLLVGYQLGKAVCGTEHAVRGAKRRASEGVTAAREGVSKKIAAAKDALVVGGKS
jgi:hypothetical protein